MSLRILGIPGSLRAGSHNRRLLRAAAALVPEGAELVLWDGLRAVPPFDEDIEDDPPLAVEAFRAAIEEASALLFATPEYNSSVPGTLKNAIDWASRPFASPVLRGKPAAVLAASTGSFGGLWAQAELQKVLGAAGARVVKAGIALPKADAAFAADGSLLDPALSEAVRDAIAALTAEVRPPVLAR